MFAATITHSITSSLYQNDTERHQLSRLMSIEEQQTINCYRSVNAQSKLPKPYIHLARKNAGN